MGFSLTGVCWGQAMDNRRRRRRISRISVCVKRAQGGRGRVLTGLAGHGAPNGYTFQYSNCTGRRKALLIGINYFHQRGELRGCINDVKNMSTYLNSYFGYKREDMVNLTDDQKNPLSQPTKANILRAMHWLVKDAQPNDSLFFHYSGHGGQTKDLDGDEDDGYDEVIYPVDFRSAGHIVDDEMHRILYVPPTTTRAAARRPVVHTPTDGDATGCSRCSRACG